jgi:hypothetical protein
VRFLQTEPYIVPMIIIGVILVVLVLFGCASRNTHRDSVAMEQVINAPRCYSVVCG